MGRQRPNQGCSEPRTVLMPGFRACDPFRTRASGCAVYFTLVADLESRKRIAARETIPHMIIRRAAAIAIVCCISSMSKQSPPTASPNTEERIQEEAAKIAAEREHLAELQQEQREKVAADLASRTDTREAQRAANLEHAAAEQARREGITAELKTFADSIWIERSQINDTVTLRMNGVPVKPGSVLVSPAGYSLKYLKEDRDYFWFGYARRCFLIDDKKDSGRSIYCGAKIQATFSGRIPS